MRSPSAQTLARRTFWRNRGDARPSFAVPPGPGQESVWDYPRPPRILAERRRVEVRLDGHLIAESVAALRVLETASPPTVYLPPSDVDMSLLREPPPASSVLSECEWKGGARYLDVVTPGRRVTGAAWSYGDPYPEFEAIRNFISFYPVSVSCSLDGEAVMPQPGRFYGGWVTAEIVGPFKGEPGSEAW